MYEPVARQFTLEQLNANATTYMRTEFGTPRQMQDEDQKAMWYTRYGLLLDFCQKLMDNEIQPASKSSGSDKP